MGDTHTETTEQLTVPASGGFRRRVGLVVLAAGVLTALVWLGWRIAHLSWHPVSLLFFGAEIVGFVAAVAVGLGLATAGDCRTVYEHETRDGRRYAVAIADIVGRTRSADLHREVRTAARAAPRWRPRNSADAAIAALLLEGPRRIVLVLATSLGLLLGVAPLPVPPRWAIATAIVAYLSFSIAHVMLGRGRLRYGDRLRWSYGAIGETLSASDLVGHAPRRWLGTMAVAVGVSVVLALRGMSDRWTHGLTPMDYDDRALAMSIGLIFVLGALITIETTPRPVPADVTVTARHLEEDGARQSLLAVAVVVAVVGLLAGLVPAGDDGAVNSGSRTPITTPVTTEVTSEVMTQVGDRDG